MKIDVLYQFDENYAPFAGVSITSLFENNKEFKEIRIFILGENLSQDSMNRLQLTAAKYKRKIVFIDSNSLICKMKELNIPTYRGSYAANMRLFLSEVLPQDINKVLYLDADTIVTKSLSELVKWNMGKFPLGMVLDSLGESHKIEIGLKKEDKYYNSGVILFQMHEWNKLKLSNEIIDHVKNIRAQYSSPDQDLINIVCRGKIMLLPPKFNFQPIHAAFDTQTYNIFYNSKTYYKKIEIEEAKKSPTIIHFFRFVGEFPWNSDNVHPNKNIFDFYLQISYWKDYKKNPAKCNKIIKFEKELYRILPSPVFLFIFKLAHRFFIYRANCNSLKNKINKNM